MDQIVYGRENVLNFQKYEQERTLVNSVGGSGWRSVIAGNGCYDCKACSVSGES